MWYVLLAAVALAGCDGITSVQKDGTFPVQVGDRAAGNGDDFSVRVLSVPGDSRCPLDVQCVWAGDAVVRLRLTSSRRSVEADLHTNSTVAAVSAELDGHVVELLQLTPSPLSGRTIAQGGYTARLRISRL